ncbi:hypothetical protein V8F33_004868 [Rhypophila sp. PSN 637]
MGLGAVSRQVHTPNTSQPPSSNTPPPQSSATATSSSPPPSSTGGSGDTPDVHLKVPNLSVGKIELDVDNVRAEVNLAAEIANLIEINAGLIIRLGHLVDIVNRTLASLDLNPLLINLLNEVTDMIDNVVGAGNTKLNLGRAGNVVSSIIGNYQTNITYKVTGITKELSNGLAQKTLVNIIFNTLGQVVQAVVVKGNQGGGGGGDTGGRGGIVATTQGTTSDSQPADDPLPLSTSTSSNSPSKNH